MFRINKRMLDILIICLVLIIIITGCGSPATKDEIQNHLQQQYKNESFTIISKNKVDSIPSDYKCGSNNSGFEYTVKSNDSGIYFKATDAMYYSSGGWCNYDITDDYQIVALNRYIEEFKDSRITIDDHMQSSDIKVDLNNFKSIDELVNVLYSFKQFYENKKPFITGNIKNGSNITVYIYKLQKYYGSVYLSRYNNEITESDIYNKIQELVNKDR